MPNIESKVYQCGTQTLNPQRWWTEPLPVKSDKTHSQFILCGGNMPAEGGAGLADDKCVRVDTAQCSVSAPFALMSTPRQAVVPVCTTGQCYFFGGNTAKATDSAKAVDEMDRSKCTFQSDTSRIPDQRLAFAATALTDQLLLITGGYGVKDFATGKGPVFNTAVLLNPVSNDSETVTMKHSRGGHSQTTLHDGTVLLVGGTGDDATGAEIFNPKDNSFTAVDSKMSAGRKDHRAVLAKDGKVYIVGGTQGAGAPTEIAVFDPATKTFSNLNGADGKPLQISQGREDMAAVYVPELNVIVALGGEVKGAAGEPESKAIDVIDLNTKTITSGQLQTPRDEATAVLRKVDVKKKTIEIIALQGQQKKDGKEISLPAELITIQL